MKSIVVGLLAYAQLVSSLASINSCPEVYPNEKLGVTYTQKFVEVHDVNAMFNAVSNDNTTVRITKGTDPVTHSITTIHNKNQGGFTSIALKFDHVEDGVVLEKYVRYFNVANASPACAVAPLESFKEPTGKEVLKEASYYSLK
jgi:hypothetical protein